MNPVVFHIAGGDAFFTGIGCLALAVVLGFSGRRWVRDLGTLACVVGLIAVAVSATPLSWWYYGLAGIVSVAWIVVVRRVKPSEKGGRVASILMAAVWLAGLGLEIPYHITPRLEVDRDETIVVYGDSVTAGIGEHEAETWPQILKRTHRADIRDFARMGATVASTLKKVQAEPPPAGTVILEIGGNDILGTTTASDFERDLDRLLDLLSRRHRRIVMFELPMPPFYNAFGAAQRKVARRYGVVLIPKRVLMGIFAADGATLDSIHLTQSGHRRLAEIVWRLLGGGE